jgi:hypothetical protein
VATIQDIEKEDLVKAKPLYDSFEKSNEVDIKDIDFDNDDKPPSILEINKSLS